MVICDSHNWTSGIGCLAIDAQENQLNKTDHRPGLSPEKRKNTTQNPHLNNCFSTLSEHIYNRHLPNKVELGKSSYLHLISIVKTLHRIGATYPSTSLLTVMTFSYPRFSGDTDIEVHARTFLNVWNGNHMLQWLPESEAHTSKIAEFGLSLDGRVAHWHSQLDITLFIFVDQPQSSFLCFFHQRIPQTRDHANQTASARVRGWFQPAYPKFMTTTNTH